MSNQPKVAPLACPRCGAAVPLGEGAVARCTYCSIDVAVPPEYIALRDDAKTRIQDRAELDRLYRQASRPPSKFVRMFPKIGRGFILGCAGAGALIILGTIVGVIIREHDFVTTVVSAAIMVVLGIPAFLETMWHLVGSHSYDLVDALGPFAGVLPGFVVWLFVAVPVNVSTRCSGAFATIIRMRMHLAAGMPLQPGGPATCRGCGAALDVPAGALGVRCTYCETDNLVAIPAVAAAKDHKEATHFHEAIEKVIPAHLQQLASQRAKLRRNLVVSLLGLACAFGVLYFPAHYFLDGSFTIARTAQGHRGELYPDDPGNSVIAHDTAQPMDLTFTWRCHGSKRMCITFHVALKRGERVSFDTSDHDLEIALQRHQHLVLSVGVWEPWVTDAKLAERAPYTGWYRVQITAPPGTDTVNTTLKWSTR